jgi:hypothetical protein
MSLTSAQVDLIVTRLASDEEWQSLTPEIRQTFLTYLYQDLADSILDRVILDVQKETRKPSRTRKPKKVLTEPEGEHA